MYVHRYVIIEFDLMTGVCVTVLCSPEVSHGNAAVLGVVLPAWFNMHDSIRIRNMCVMYVLCTLF